MSVMSLCGRGEHFWIVQSNSHEKENANPRSQNHTHQRSLSLSLPHINGRHACSRLPNPPRIKQFLSSNNSNSFQSYPYVQIYLRFNYVFFYNWVFSKSPVQFFAISAPPGVSLLGYFCSIPKKKKRKGECMIDRRGRIGMERMWLGV